MTPMLLFLLACGGDSLDTGDTAPEATTDRHNEPVGCELVEVGHDGPDPPILGDAWTVWPICDGDPVFGATVIRVDPATCASMAENVLTWVEAGTCTIMAQTGSQRAYLDVEVAEAR